MVVTVVLGSVMIELMTLPLVVTDLELRDPVQSPHCEPVSVSNVSMTLHNIRERLPWQVGHSLAFSTSR